jgi:5-methylcytosine-specific restriction endonuclease McrA
LRESLKENVKLVSPYRIKKGGGIFSNFEKNIGVNGKLSRKVLVLNHNYEPLSICNVRKAVILLFLGKAELIAVCDGKSLHSVSMTMPYPSIVRLSVYVRIPFKKIVLSRKNILRRDEHRCQYCGKTDVVLTVDHVVPKAHGGMETWENLVAACKQCNNKKGDRTPGEAQMTLLRKPIRPNHIMFIRHYVGTVDDHWKPYLFMN